jgi:hypothetical protein
MKFYLKDNRSGSEQTVYDAEFSIHAVPPEIFMLENVDRAGGLLAYVIEPQTIERNHEYETAMNEFIDRVFRAGATIEQVRLYSEEARKPVEPNKNSVKVNMFPRSSFYQLTLLTDDGTQGILLDLDYPLPNGSAKELGAEIREQVNLLSGAMESRESSYIQDRVLFVVNYKGLYCDGDRNLIQSEFHGFEQYFNHDFERRIKKYLLNNLGRSRRGGSSSRHLEIEVPRMLKNAGFSYSEPEGEPNAFEVRFDDTLAVIIDNLDYHEVHCPPQGTLVEEDFDRIWEDWRRKRNEFISNFVESIPRFIVDHKSTYDQHPHTVSVPVEILCFPSKDLLSEVMKGGFDEGLRRNTVFSIPNFLPFVINEIVSCWRVGFQCTLFGFRPESSLGPDELPKSRTKDLTVASKIFCLMSLWHLFRKREEMIGKRLKEGGDGSSFKSVPLALKGLAMPLVPAAEIFDDGPFVPHLFFLLGDDGFASHLASSGRELPEASEFAKANLFPIDSPELYDDDYEIAKKAFVFLSENGFETEDLLRVGRILRELCDEEGADLQKLSEALVRDPHEDVTAGERSPYVTPQNLRDTAISLWFEEKADNFHDPACGLGGFLLGALDRASSSAADNFDFMRFSGSDSDASTLSLCKMLFLLRAAKSFEPSSTDVQHGLVDLIGKVAPNFRLEDSLSKLDSKKAKKRDFVACDPPFDEVAVQGADSDLIHHFFVRLVVEGLADGGSAAIVLPHSYLKSERDADSRRHLLETGLLEKVMESEPGDSEGRSVVLFLSDDSTEDAGEAELSISFSGLGALAGAAVAAAAKTMPVVAATVAAVSAYKTFRKPKDILEDPNCPIEPHLDFETASRLLNESSFFKFSDWPCEEVPKGPPGVYQIFDEDKLIFVGSSAKNLFDRLNGHASGRRGGDQFCVNLCDRLIMPTLDPDQMKKLAAGELNLDQDVKKFVGERLSFKFFVSPSREFARDFQSHLLSLADPEHLLNPDPQ